ncbi:uncharacterized protein LOC107848768 [Capsicum annuum]|uniref:uncharacterized protein LOC107848768 n=1 Tax=Capsicum annuum TaxID=4072 RepID=UPI001FB15998|nr:uncharacterized protein LOC107848768 [Capsicum annuum]
MATLQLALLGRNKIGLVDGSCTKESVNEELWGQWERVNAIVLSWLLNSVSKNLLGGVAFAFSAYSVWEDLRERFDRAEVIPASHGINKSYNQARSQILLMDPVPSVNQSYVMIVSDECQKFVASSSGSIGMNTIMANGMDPMVMYSRNSGFNGRN